MTLPPCGAPERLAPDGFERVRDCRAAPVADADGHDGVRELVGTGDRPDAGPRSPAPSQSYSMTAKWMWLSCSSSVAESKLCLWPLS